MLYCCRDRLETPGQISLHINLSLEYCLLFLIYMLYIFMNKWVYLQHVGPPRIRSETTFPDRAWRHPYATVSAGRFCFGSASSLKRRTTQDGLHPPLPFALCIYLYLRGIPAEFHRPFRRWFGFRGLGLLWTPQFTHSKPGPPGRGRTPVYRLLLYQPRL